jgi:hypothetical protein
MSLADDVKAQREADAAQVRRIALAFQAVFGQERGRSSDQRIVLACLAAQCGQDKAHSVLDKEGRVDPASAVFFEGSRRVYLFIEGQLKAAQLEPANPDPISAPKPKSVKR